MKIPVHILSGFLGTGKTTVLRAELARRNERCAIIVNDFGEAKIDRELLGGAVGISDIAGGCICCTAPAGLVPAIETILEEIKPDRLFIEPSGLARPQDIADMLSRSALKERVDLRPTIVLVDPQRWMDAPNPLMEEQLDAADVVVASRCDLATPDAIATFDQKMATRWPRPLLILHAEHGNLPEEVWDWPAFTGLRLQKARHQDHPSTDGYVGRSFEFPVSETFAWDAVRDLLNNTPNLERFKGLFRADIGMVRIDWAGGHLHAEPTGYRRDSRADAIFREPADLEAFSAALTACKAAAEASPSGPTVTLVNVDGQALQLGREALRRLPGQVPDVSLLVPGREGSGIYLRELMALAPGGDRYLLAAADGMTTKPATLRDLGEAVLVHSLGDGPLPEKQGGPFRVLAAPGSGNCANVKGLVRIRLLPGD